MIIAAAPVFGAASVLQLNTAPGAASGIPVVNNLGHAAWLQGSQVWFYDGTTSAQLPNISATGPFALSIGKNADVLSFVNSPALGDVYRYDITTHAETKIDQTNGGPDLGFTVSPKVLNNGDIIFYNASVPSKPIYLNTAGTNYSTQIVATGATDNKFQPVNGGTSGDFTYSNSSGIYYYQGGSSTGPIPWVEAGGGPANDGNQPVFADTNVSHIVHHDTSAQTHYWTRADGTTVPFDQPGNDVGAVISPSGKIGWTTQNRGVYYADPSVANSTTLLGGVVSFTTYTQDVTSVELSDDWAVWGEGPVDGGGAFHGNIWGWEVGTPVSSKFQISTNGKLGYFDGTGLAQSGNDQIAGRYAVWDDQNGNAFLATVPEPASSAILGVGLIGLLHRRRRTANR